MKAIFLSLAVLALSSVVAAQPSTTAATAPQSQSTTAQESSGSAIEKLSARSGRMIERKTYPAGDAIGVRVFAVKTTDLKAKETLHGVRIEQDQGNASAGYTPRSYSAYLDPDELTGLVTVMRFLKKDILPTAPAIVPATDYTFTTRGRVELKCYSSQGKWLLSLHVGPGIKPLASGDIDALLPLLEKAQALITANGG